MYRVELSNQLDNVGEQYVDMGKVSDSLPYYSEEISILRKLIVARSTNHKYAEKVAEALSKLGNIQRHDGDSGSAAESFKEAQAALERVGEGDATHQGLWATILTRHAVVLSDLGKMNEALPFLQRSVDVLSHLGPAATPEEDDRARGWLSDSLWELARISRATGQTVKAEECDSQRAALWSKQPSAKLAKWALGRAKQALLIGYGKTPINDRARTVRELDLDQAAANLRLAISLGFKDLSMLRENPDSWALLGRDDVQPLLMDLAFPAWPFVADHKNEPYPASPNPSTRALSLSS